MGNLTYLCGPSRSGKSTFANKWIKEEDPKGLHRVVVNADAIRWALHGRRYNSHAEPLVFSTKYLMIKTLLVQGYHVLNDGTNTTETSIKRLLEIDPNATPIIFDTPPDICVQRMHSSQQLDLGPVIKRHHDQLQKLLLEGIDNVHARLLKDIDNRWKVI